MIKQSVQGFIAASQVKYLGRHGKIFRVRRPCDAGSHSIIEKLRLPNVATRFCADMPDRIRSVRFHTGGRMALGPVFAVLLVLTGCGDSQSNSTPVTPVQATPKPVDAATVPSTEENSEDRLPLVQVDRDEIPVDNPAEQGWQSESFTEQVNAVLKNLAKQIEYPEQATAEFLDPAFAGAPVRPSNLVTVYADAPLIVRRWNTESSSESKEASIGFQESLASLTAEVGALQAVRVKTKVFGVELNVEAATTDLYFQLFGKHAEGTLQVTSTWRCRWNVEAGPRLMSIEPIAYEEVLTDASQPLFVDTTTAIIQGDVYDQQLRHGIDYWLTRIESSRGIDVGGWQGLAVADVNGDGLDDLYICQPGGLPNRLYVQNADGTATETSAAAGVDWLEGCHAALFVDLDNDVDQDLIVGLQSGVLVLSNDGHGRFTPRAAMVLPAALPYSMAAADVDVDGDLDIFVCCYNRRQGINRHLLFARPVPYHDANNGGRNVLLMTESTPVDGAWRFRYGTGRRGLDVNNRKFSYAAAWDDYDNDGDLDLYVANDFGRNNLYQNQGDGTFRDVAAEAGVEDIGPGMSTCWGDFNNDGWVDLYVSNMFSSAGNRITQQSQFQEDVDADTRSAFRRHARGNSLFTNLANGRFQDVSKTAGVSLGRWAWGSLFADLNRDGWQDLVVANGFITQPDTGDL